MLLGLVPALPLAGFAVLALAGRSFSRSLVAAVGTGAVGLSMLAALWVGARQIALFPPDHVVTLALWDWLQVGPFHVRAGLYLDALSVVMILVVTGVGFLIHLYSIRFMAGDEGYVRFFAVMNLFVASMLILVLADGLLLLFLCWEGVGLCSYLLIGFWYREPANVRAADKAFIVTRVGDAALLAALLLLFVALGTLNIRELAGRAAREWSPGAAPAVAAAALLLAGAVGKSAQLPLQVWLPDAMAGPTPVSALIHAATMVTAGVYLIARLHGIFNLAPAVRFLAAVIGAATLLMAGFSALAQRDIKRALAWSTISQLGYMFLALGVGAWPAAVFHLVTHAFFKSVLFLGAGVVIQALAEEHDLYRMGGLWNRLPVAFWTFLAGALSMSAIPPFTAGFYSKDWILYWVWTSSGQAGFILWLVGLAGVFLTAAYTFRLVFLVFLGPPAPGRLEPRRRPAVGQTVSLVLLAVPAALIGFLETPRTMGDIRLFSRFLHGALPAQIVEQASRGTETLLQALSELASALGIAAAWLISARQRRPAAAAGRPPLGEGRPGFLEPGWGFDRVYDLLLVRPYAWLARINRDDVVDRLYEWIAALNRSLNRGLSLTQTGRLRTYAGAITAGAAAILAWMVLR